MALTLAMQRNPAEDRQKARVEIDAATARLSPHDRVVVLQDALYVAERAAMRPAPAPPPPRKAERKTRAAAPAKAGDLFPAPAHHQDNGAEAAAKAPIWKRVYTYCVETDPRRVYLTTQVAKAMAPDDPAARANIYVAVLRKSTKSDRPVKTPIFDWIGDGKFKLREDAIALA